MSNLQLNELRIQGVRAIGTSPLVISNMPAVTILAATNGVGKTSVIGGLTLALTDSLWLRHRELGPEQLRHRNGETVAAACAEVAAVFGGKDVRPIEVAWSYDGTERRWSADEVRRLSRDDASKSLVARRFELTHLLPQGWGKRFQDIRPTDRRALLHNHLRLDSLRVGLKALQRGGKVGRAASARESRLSDDVERCVERLERWTEVVGRWHDARERALPSELTPRNELVRQLEELAREAGIAFNDAVEAEALAGEIARWISKRRSALVVRGEALIQAERVLHEFTETTVVLPGLQETVSAGEARVAEHVRAVDKLLEDFSVRLEELRAEIGRVDAQAATTRDAAEEYQRSLRAARESAHELVSLLSRMRADHVRVVDGGSEVCPVCDTVHASGELVRKIDSKVDSLAGAALEGLEQQVRSSQAARADADRRASKVRQELERTELEFRFLQGLQRLATAPTRPPGTMVDVQLSNDEYRAIAVACELACVRLVDDRRRLEEVREHRSRLIHAWQQAGLDGVPNLVALEAARGNDLGGAEQLEQFDVRLRSLASTLDRHNDRAAAIGEWEFVVGQAQRLLGASLEAPRVGDDKWIETVRGRLEADRTRCEQALRVHKRRWLRVERIRDEVGNKLSAVDRVLGAELGPLISEFLRVLTPDLAQRVEMRMPGNSIKLRANGLDTDFVLSEGEQSALALAILFAMHVRFDWCRWRGLVLDDPFQSADVVCVAALLDVLAGLAKERHTQIILTTHDVEHGYWCARRMAYAGVDAALYQLRQSAGGVEARLLS